MAEDTELETLLGPQSEPKVRDLSRSSELLAALKGASASSESQPQSHPRLGHHYSFVVGENGQPLPGSGSHGRAAGKSTARNLLSSHKFSFPTSPSRTPLFADVGSPQFDSLGNVGFGVNPGLRLNMEEPKTGVPRLTPAQRKESLTSDGRPSLMDDPYPKDGSTPKRRMDRSALRLALKQEHQQQHQHFDRSRFLGSRPGLADVGSPPSAESGSRNLTTADSATQSSFFQHAFLTDVNDVKTMERNLLKLLGDFHSGKLLAFGQSDNMSQMENIRKQQEQLARLHFELGAELHQEPKEPTTKDAFSAGIFSPQRVEKSKQNMHKLTDSLKQLSISIEGLNRKDTDSHVSDGKV